MDSFPPALEHGAITEVLPEVFFVSGAMETVLQDIDWRFSRNMTVVRECEGESKRLILINSVRLDDSGLAALDALGQVTDVIRLGALHGRDDAFYVDRYDAAYWTLPGVPAENGLNANQFLNNEAPLPIADASVFIFATTQVPEAILRLERAGGVLIACDALQNWCQPDAYFADATRDMMQDMGFFTRANIGPVWLQAAAPAAEDFQRLQSLAFSHVLCGHGEPLKDSAGEAYAATFTRVFGV